MKYKEFKADEWVNKLIRVERTSYERRRHNKTDSPPTGFSDAFQPTFTAQLELNESFQRSHPMAVPVRSASMPADLDVPSLAIRRRPTPRKVDPDVPSSVSPRLKRASPSSSYDRTAPLSPSSDDIAANYSKLITAELIPSAVPLMVEDESLSQSAVWIGDASTEPPAYISAILPSVAPTDYMRHFYPCVSLAGAEYQIFDHIEVRMSPGALSDHPNIAHSSNPLRSSLMNSPTSAEPGIARIVALFEEPSGRRCVFLEWYYRKSDVLSHLLAMKNYEEVVRNPPNSPSGSLSSMSGEEEKVRTPRRGRPPKKRRGNIEESLSLLETTLDHEIFNAPKPHYTLVPLGAISAPCFVEHIPLHLSASAAAAAAAAAAAEPSNGYESQKEMDETNASEPHRYIYRRTYEFKTCYLPGCKARSTVTAPTPSTVAMSGTAFHPALHQLLSNQQQPLSARSLGSSGSSATAPMPTPPSVSSLARSAPSIHGTQPPQQPASGYGSNGMSFTAVPYLHHLPTQTGVSSPRNPHSPHTPHSPHPIGGFYSNESATSSPRTPVTGMEALFPFTPTASPRRGFMQLSASSPALPSGPWEQDEFSTMSPRTKMRKTFEVDQQTIHYRSSMTPQPAHTTQVSHQHFQQPQHQHGSQTHQLPLQYHSGQPQHYGNAPYALSQSSDELYSPRYHQHSMNTRVTTVSGNVSAHVNAYSSSTPVSAQPNGGPDHHSGYMGSMQMTSAPNYQAYPDSAMSHDSAGGWNHMPAPSTQGYARSLADPYYPAPHASGAAHPDVDVPQSVSPAFLAPTTLPSHLNGQHSPQPPHATAPSPHHAHGQSQQPMHHSQYNGMPGSAGGTTQYSSMGLGMDSQLSQPNPAQGANQGYMQYGSSHMMSSTNGASPDPSMMNGMSNHHMHHQHTHQPQQQHHHQHQHMSNHHLHQPSPHHGHYMPSNGHYGASFNSDPSQSYPGSTLDHDGISGIVPTFQLKVEEQDDPSMLGDMVAGAPTLDDFSAPNSGDALGAGGSVSSALSFASMPHTIPRSTSPGLGMDFRTTPPPSMITPPPSDHDHQFH